MIGIFDSGVGGLSVWKELVKLLPRQRYIYVSDSGYCPYGPKSKEYIIDRCSKISQFIINEGADIIVVACNTATAAAIKTLRTEFSIPFVGMEPAVKPAALHSKSGVIGVLATKGTFKGELYIGTLQKFASDIKVLEQIGEGLVEIVEQGKTDTPQAEKLLRTYVEPMLQAGADHIVLGCTHYPFLTDIVSKIAGETVAVVNPAPAIAKRTLDLLQEIGHETDDTNGNNVFYTTGQNLILLKDMVKSIVKECGVDTGRINSYKAVSI